MPTASGFFLCARCLKYSDRQNSDLTMPLQEINDAEAVAQSFASAVNDYRWDIATNSPKEDGTWVIEFYNDFFFNYSAIFYTVDSNVAQAWVDFPALAKARVKAEQWRRKLDNGPGSRPSKTWWFGEHSKEPHFEIKYVDPKKRYVVVKFQHWRLWGTNETAATGGAIWCHLVLRANRASEFSQVQVVRYWHDWLGKDNTVPERDLEIFNIINDLRERNLSLEELAPLRGDTKTRICVFGANEDFRTHLMLKTLQGCNIRAVFVGRVAAYPFETLLQVSLRTGLHFPICFADLSEGAGTPIEVQALVNAGKVVAGLHPTHRMATQFLKDHEVNSRVFRLFSYDWPAVPADGSPPNINPNINKEHVENFVSKVKEALDWAESEAARTTSDLLTAFPWREYETESPQEAIKLGGECHCDG